MERTTNLEIVRIVDGGFGAKGLAFFMVLLDLGLLVLDVQRGHDPLGQDARAEAPRRAARDAPVENELHLRGRPRSRFSRITSSKKQRPVRG
jgi:hypothetical protein